jgi:hypothetical protein
MRSIHYVAFLLLLLIAFIINGSTFSHSLNRFATTTSTIHHESNSVDTNNDTVYFSIYNHMPVDNIEFYINHLMTSRTILSPGEMITQASNLDSKACFMYWKQFCTTFHVYDPKMYGNHRDIVFIVKSDGVFYCWDDNTLWDKKSTWYLC